MDPELLLEAGVLLVNDVRLRLELLTNSGGAAILVLEWLTNGARISADGPLCFEWVGPPSLLIVAPERLLRSPGRVRIVAGPDSIHPLRGRLRFSQCTLRPLSRR